MGQAATRYWNPVAIRYGASALEQPLGQTELALAVGELARSAQSPSGSGS